jgi:hypothetical protein
MQRYSYGERRGRLCGASLARRFLSLLDFRIQG